MSFAPEAGSERLRRVIRKGITEDDILRAVEFTSRHKLRQLRLYFMVGLPTETDDDIEAIANLTLKCKSILEKRARHHPNHAKRCTVRTEGGHAI